MAKGSPIYNPDVQSDIDMKNTYKLVNYPASSNILSVANTIYVDAINGSSLGQRGTTSAFQTLAQAVAVVQAGDMIEVRSNLTYSGLVTITAAGVTLDFRNHVITCSSQTDTSKINISGVGVTIKNLEINGTWDHSTSGTPTGAALNSVSPSTRWENIYVHDIMDNAFTFNGDWSNSVFKNLRVDWCKQSGFYANSQNALINNAAEFGQISITNCVLGKGLAIARGGAGTNPVNHVNAHDIFYDNIDPAGADEGMYVHGLSNFQISNVRGRRNVFNISLDACDRGTLDNIITHGGLSNQYCGLEMAGCYYIDISNSIFDGSDIDGTASPATGNISGIVSSNLSSLSNYGHFVFTNVQSFGWPFGFQMAGNNGHWVEINGGYYSGSQYGISFDGIDHIHVRGSTVETVGGSGVTPITIRAEGHSYSDFSVLSCFLNASSSCESEISLYSAVASAVIDTVTISGNTKLDSNSLASGQLKTLTGSGGVITNLKVSGNVPSGDWTNVTGWANVLSTPKLGVKTDTPTASADIVGGQGDPNNRDPVLRLRPSGHTDYAVDIISQFSNSKNLIINLTGTTPANELLSAPQDGSLLNTVPVSLKHLANASAPNDTLFYSTTISGIAYRDSGGTVHSLSGSGTSATIQSTLLPLKGDNAGNAVAVTATGTGDTVLATSPTLITPTIGVATATSVNKWTLTAPSTSSTLVAGADNCTYTFPAVSCNVGFREIPQNSKSANYTTILTDNGKHLYHPASDANARTFTIDSNANVAYLVGTAITFVNLSANAVTIAITADTMYLAGAGTTGSRTLAQYGTATALKTASTEWVIQGVGLS